MNMLALKFALDTNVVAEESPPMARLRTMHDEGWIELTRTDTLDTELGDASDDKRAALFAQSARYVEHFGPMVIEHSRLDHCVIANDEDAQRLDHVFALLFPNTPRMGASGRWKRKLRDAMHVATAIRYACTGFITTDGRDLLRRADAVREAFDHFLILTPEQAVTIAERMLSKHRYREEHPRSLT